jgi:poly-beta-1,6-N-acetyl-D-glucosamine synthase
MDSINAKASTRYVLVTPVRDEEMYLPLCIQSVAHQVVRPQEWIIVNDGSKDNTGQIADEAAAAHPWIRVVHRDDRGYRKWGAGIIEAFYAGFDALQCKDWDFMCKLDGDLSFAAGYFEGAFARFAANPKIGIGGGVLYYIQDGVKVPESHPVFHVRGGVKIYRRPCWDALGGLWVGPGSDLIDETKANMLGWITQSFTDLELQHHRPTGQSYGRWGGSVKDGKIDYVTGYHPLFLIAKWTSRLVRKPYIVTSLGMMYGYFSALFQRMPRVDDPALIQYIRRQQLARLFGGETIWK